ncbi:MAG: hypothetical protein WKG07_46075 [Hymenobacter sp.]
MHTYALFRPVAGRQARGAGRRRAGALTYTYGTARYGRDAATGCENTDPPAPGSARTFTRLVEGITGSTLRSGGRGAHPPQRRPDLRRHARRHRRRRAHIDLSSYIIWPGEITDRFVTALAARAMAGVQVNLVVDAYGSAKLDHKTVDALEEAGVNFAWFRPPPGTPSTS